MQADSLTELGGSENWSAILGLLDLSTGHGAWAATPLVDVTPLPAYAHHHPTRQRASSLGAGRVPALHRLALS